MKVLSVNVGTPREVEWHGQTVQTSIWKSPVNGRVPMTTLNLAGDRQSDLSVHGGPEKAVYIYPVEHYAHWSAELPETALPWGAFGENLTIEGLLETDVRIGDRLSIGSSELMVTQPRMPCYKLGIRLGRDDILKPFLQSGRTGFYVAVIRPGDVGAGDRIDFASRDARGVSVADVVALYSDRHAPSDRLKRVVDLTVLPEGWRRYFAKRLRPGHERRHPPRRPGPT